MGPRAVSWPSPAFAMIRTVGTDGYRDSGSPHVSVVWWAEIDEDASYVDAANEFWGLAFGVHPDGPPSATMIGPSLEPRGLHLAAGER